MADQPNDKSVKPQQVTSVQPSEMSGSASQTEARPDAVLRPRSKTVGAHPEPASGSTAASEQTVSDRRSKLRIEIPSPPAHLSLVRPLDSSWSKKPSTPYVKGDPLADSSDTEEPPLSFISSLTPRSGPLRTSASPTATVDQKRSLDGSSASAGTSGRYALESRPRNKEKLPSPVSTRESDETPLISITPPQKRTPRRMSSPPLGHARKSSIRTPKNVLPAPVHSESNESSSRVPTGFQRPSVAYAFADAISHEKAAAAAAAVPDIVVNPPKLVPQIEPMVSTHAKALKDVPLEELDPKLRAKWLLDVDVQDILRRRDLEGAIKAKREQERLAQAYRRWRTKRDARAADANATLAWLNTIRAIGRRGTHEPEFHAFLHNNQMVDCGIADKQRKLCKALTNAVTELSGVSVAEQMRADVGLPPRDLSQTLDYTKEGTWTIAETPLPYGATVDDAGAKVTHYLLWTCHDLLDVGDWSARDLADVRRNGVGGFVGFRGQFALGPTHGLGFTGFPGVRNIELAIATRFDPRKYRVAWFINSVERSTVPGLPHLHLWVARKRLPGYFQLWKLRRFIRAVNRVEDVPSAKLPTQKPGGNDEEDLLAECSAMCGAFAGKFRGWMRASRAT